MRILTTPEQLSTWDQRVLANPDGGNVLQLKAFGEFKRGQGWRPVYALHDADGREVAVLYLTRRVPGLGELWYAPKGPGVTTIRQLSQIIDDFRASRATSSSRATAPKNRRAFLLKVEPELDAVAPGSMETLGLAKAKFDLQMNRSTVIVDLRPDEPEILAGFKQKTRYNVRLAERKGVRVAAVALTPETENQMLGLMRATQARGGFFMRDDNYYRALWRGFAAAGQGQLFIASYQGQPLAGAFVLYAGGKALYKDGGSVRQHSELQPPYALQWHVISWLKARGVSEYDLHGTPPSSQLDNPAHPLASLATFKTGFQPGVVIDYLGVYDLPLKPTAYKLWQVVGERLTTAVHTRLVHKLFY